MVVSPRSDFTVGVVRDGLNVVATVVGTKVGTIIVGMEVVVVVVTGSTVGTIAG